MRQVAGRCGQAAAMGYAQRNGDGQYHCGKELCGNKWRTVYRLRPSKAAAFSSRKAFEASIGSRIYLAIHGEYCGWVQLLGNCRVRMLRN
jgi:hypothetical protein